MATPTQSLLGALAATTVMVTGALCWAGLRLLDQQQLLDEQRARDHAASAADAIAADVRGKLAEAGERLSGWIANPSSPLPTIAGAVIVGIQGDRVDVNPQGGLPYVPVAPDQTPTESFAALESIEVRGDGARAAAGYSELLGHRDPATRAGALLRLGRVQRKLGDLAGAVVSYQHLAQLGSVRVGDLPAELAALHGQRATYLAMADRDKADAVARQVLHGLDAGRWLVARGPAELYREPFRQPRPPSWSLANALSDVWRDAGGRPLPQGYRVVAGDASTGGNVLVLWRSSGAATTGLAARTDIFFDLPSSAPVSWQLADADGRIIDGRTPPPDGALTRIVSSTYPWTLHAWTDSAAPTTGTSSRAILLWMMGATLAFLWGAAYFMARAIRQEAAVSRLRSDFLAAVSHEFRSPLTAIRQMAEMLDGDRIPTSERRHTYYASLAAEAARLQRLVETLLDFGRMEAGAARYRFVDLDAAVLVREVVDEMGPHARELGIAIQTDGPETGIRVHADHGALVVALRNLIDNAIKYSPGEPAVWVRWCKDRNRAAICVVDRGVGIPRFEQRRIFGKFVRGHAAIAANIRGTGVGLAIVEQIVTAHGGEIRLESEPGQGSTFTLLLPASV